MFSPRLLSLLLLAFHAGGVTSCREPNTASQPPLAFSGNLELLGSYPLEVKEPSGLELAPDGRSLWIVSDEKGMVHQTDLEGGEIRRFRTGVKDAEGITLLDRDRIAVVSERNREILVFDQDGELQRSGRLNLAGDDNKGPEGLDFDPAKRRFYVLKEADPGLLLVLDEQLRELSRRELDFAEDYSSIVHEPVRDHLWILSDRSQNIHVVDEEGAVQTTFSANIVQPEGLAVDYANRLLYIVSDATEMLHVFRFADY